VYWAKTRVVPAKSADVTRIRDYFGLPIAQTLTPCGTIMGVGSRAFHNVSAGKTKAPRVYTGTGEAAVREAAKRNNLPIG
jgi:hypothetical protein